ncbi:class I SAM-dependent methyltransferase [Hahella sp. SMD15-11]|uniref:Class I SAM-dependent methyltransferase n=1 Tax=Thermohahella caldifontis TaxID=3142973 RepID=A0AB39UVI9_9GAMM
MPIQLPATHHPEALPARLLTSQWALLNTGPDEGPVLDLACGSGQNGLWLAQQGYTVDFVDRSDEALAHIRTVLARDGHPCLCQTSECVEPRRAGTAGTHRLLKVDLESGLRPMLPGAHYAAILVFRYLHRPLIPAILAALKPGGILMYETFTREQARFGRPRNPDLLLEPEEVLTWLPGVAPLFYREGIEDTGGQPRAIAQLVIRRPAD